MLLCCYGYVEIHAILVIHIVNASKNFIILEIYNWPFFFKNQYILWTVYVISPDGRSLMCWLWRKPEMSNCFIKDDVTCVQT